MRSKQTGHSISSSPRLAPDNGRPAANKIWPAAADAKQLGVMDEVGAVCVGELLAVESLRENSEAGVEEVVRKFTAEFALEAARLEVRV